MDKEVFDSLLKNSSRDFERLAGFGTSIGKLYTDHGFPIDMALARVPLTKDERAVVLLWAQHWLIEHKRNSGASEKAIERQRATNRRTYTAFISTGESGIY